ncbi:hypothetical protein K438DRAFT_447105 [Mycena galopus ATCC 62051]|nr:hypothetical protein K438DRAFT_447105 [Mycena galopus ATCC 62051]
MRALFDVPGGPGQPIFDGAEAGSIPTEKRDENEPSNSRIGGELVEKQAIGVRASCSEIRNDGYTMTSRSKTSHSL